MGQVQTFLLIYLRGFISGFGLREIISQYRRREARKEREARHARSRSS